MVFSLVIICLSITLMGWASIKEFKTEVAGYQGMTYIYPLMADALLKGQLHLDPDVSPNLLKSARPYDPADRGVNRIEEYTRNSA
jgi:hypothetical protein